MPSCARAIRRACSSARFGVGDLGLGESVLQRARELLADRRAEPLPILRREDRIQVELRVLLEARRSEPGLDAVAQAFLFAHAVGDPRLGRRAEDLVGDDQRRQVVARDR